MDELGINDVDYEDDVTQEVVEEDSQEESQEESTSDSQPAEEFEDISDSDVVDFLLKSKGISDKSKIKYENDFGEIEEVDWNNLSKKDKLNIINTREAQDTDQLYDDEIALINQIRSSNMSPQEYLQYVAQDSINRYAQNAQDNYSIDQYSDDELYLLDLVQKVGQDNLTEEKALKELEKAKEDKDLFTKKVAAIRDEYKNLEEQQRQQSQQQAQAQYQQQYQQFANTIAQSIDNFGDFSGMNFELTPEDKSELYEFIMGTDSAGVSILGKAFNDPRTLVNAAWFALNSQKIFDDINNYFSEEIKNVRKQSYQQGVEDAQNGKVKTRSQVVTKPKSSKTKQSNLENIW